MIHWPRKFLAPPARAVLAAGLDGPAFAEILPSQVLPSRKPAADTAAGGSMQAMPYAFVGAPAHRARSTSGSGSITEAALTEARVSAAAGNGVSASIARVAQPGS